jgi:glucose-6-phosphate isomerase
MINQLYFSNDDKALHDFAFQNIQSEVDNIGYYNLVHQDISHIQAFDISDEIDTIAVIGIGGSSLGAKAIYEFIKPIKPLKRELIFFESTDPINIQNTLKAIDINKTHFIVISKSGTTIETIAIFKYIYSLQSDINYYTFITDSGSKLESFAKNQNANIFLLPPNVGGRFSVLSVVGLLPLSLCGIDIQQLLAGARDISSSFFDNGYIQKSLLNKASFYAKNHARYHINCLFAYSEALSCFTQWYVQLWGESLGKRQKHSAFHVGLTPVGLIGPKDQHSFLQLIMEGTRDKTVTFIKIKDFENDLKIPSITLTSLESMDIINDISFSQLIDMQCDSITQAIESQGDIPLDSITIDKANEYNIGSLIFYYELLTSLVGTLIDVDTYNQPGVELGKVILKQKLI